MSSLVGSSNVHFVSAYSLVSELTCVNGRLDMVGRVEEYVHHTRKGAIKEALVACSKITPACVNVAVVAVHTEGTSKFLAKARSCICVPV